MADLYAIVGSMPRARFMLDCGVPYLQLRFKDEPLAPHAEEVAGWSAAYPATRLIVNDDLALAERVGAWGVHLGQEDLARHDPAAVRGTRLKLGISTHSDAEIDDALARGAAMLGFGPIYATATKALKHTPTGPARLAEVVRRSPVPIVAIGGITDANLGEVVATGVAMVAMIANLDPLTEPARVHALMARLRGGG